MLAAIVLAAGASTRFGANKLLLPFGDHTVIGATASLAAAAGLAPLVVVTGHERERVEAAVRSAAEVAQFVHNADFAEGEMLSSVQAGLRALTDMPADGALIVLGDMPLVGVRVFDALRAAFSANPAVGPIVAPIFRGKRGHPVLFARSLWPSLLALPRGAQPRDVIERHGDRLVQVEVATDAILLDVDTPERYREAFRRAREEGGIGA